MATDTLTQTQSPLIIKYPGQREKTKILFASKYFVYLESKQQIKPVEHKKKSEIPVLE